MTMRPWIALAAAAIAGGAMAQTLGPFGPFFPIAGQQEFSGRMTVRPLTRQAWMARGLTQTQADAAVARARQRVATIALRSVPQTGEILVDIPTGQDEQSLAGQLMRTGDYEYAVPDWFVYPVRTPNDPMFSQQWHHQVMGSPTGWNIATGASNVTVAVVDTGVKIDHVDLQAQMVPGYNSVDRQTQANGGDVTDINGHGTHVAGCAAAIGNNGVGVTGVGWRFKIMPIRTSNSPGGGASLADITHGAMWAAENGAKVVSASYSGVDSPSVGTAGTYIKTKNALFLYAAGNDNRNLSGFSYADTIVVGASDEGDGKAGFSAYGRGVAVFAPGTNILSTTSDGAYGGASGTSMATPVANGVVALIWSIAPSLNASQVQDVLYDTCENIGDPNIFGNGRVSVALAAAEANRRRLQTSLVQPYFLGLMLGTRTAGSLADVVAGRSVGYQIRSAWNANLGWQAGAEFRYRWTGARNRVETLTPQLTVSLDNSAWVTGMVHVWNNRTARWEFVKSYQLPTVNRPFTMAPVLTQPPSDLIASDGTIRVMVRGLSPTRRQGVSPSAYTLKLRTAPLKVGYRLSD